MFITLEGIDGCGKSTQAVRVAAMLEAAGQVVCRTREPGGWSGGAQLREILLTGSIAHRWTEALLFVADRCEHVAQVVRPAMVRDQTVVCERYSDSTLVYQCWGRGLDRKRVEELLSWCDLPVPDLTFWLALPPDVALTRRRSRGCDDRFEAEKDDFHQRLHQGFSQLARENDRIVRIDGSVDEQAVSEAMKVELSRRGFLS